MNNVKPCDVLIIGGGAAGLAAALTAARRGLKVCLLEKNDRCGKKLSQTGNGRCNYTNKAIAPSAYNSDSMETVETVLSAFGWQQTVAFFEGIGIVPSFREGYCYPASGEARSFSDMLTAAVSDAGAEIIASCTMTGIEETGGGFLVSAERTIESNGKKGPSGKKAASKVSEAAEKAKNLVSEKGMTYCTKSLVLASGGAAAPKTGSAGEGYRFLEGLGLPLVKPLPALTSLHLGKPYDPALFGIRAQGSVLVRSEGKVLSEDRGEIQFAKEGLSGIPVMNVSGRAVRALDAGKPVELILNMFPEGMSAEILFSIVKKSGRERTVSLALTGLLSYKSVPFFLAQAGLKRDMTVGAFQMQDAEKLCKVLTGLTFPVTGFADFNRAQVTSGGLLLASISPTTMEVKGHPGLYVIGEMLNCDGSCGGYNLQWAFATGYLSGQAVCGKGKLC